MSLRAPFLILPLIALASTAFAFDRPDYDRERLDVLGWGDGCSVAVAQYGDPPEGAVDEDPLLVRIGVLTIPPGQTKEKDDWMISLHGPSSWRPHEADKILALLSQRGYSKPGVTEDIGKSPVVDARDLPKLINTTETLKPVPGKTWPGRDWRWTGMVYGPLSTCALFIYQARDFDAPFYNYLLVRINNPGARPARAEARLTNAFLLMEKGDLDSAILESATAARLDPNNASARYHHARLLALSGEVEPAIDELEAAIRLDAQYKKKAKNDKDLESLRWHPKFKEMTK
jgi:hypothetical protein